MLQATFDMYRDAFLYSLALFWEVEIPAVSLPDRAAEAAFALNSAYGGMELDEPPEVVEEATDGLPWDEEVRELPAELKIVWQRCVSGDKKIDLKGLLDGVPPYDTLPRKPPVNNYRGHAGYRNDKVWRSWQQSILHVMRIQAKVLQEWQAVGPQAELHKTLAQSWQLQGELYMKILQARKEASLPGSVGAPAEDEVLFSKDDMAAMSVNQRINAAKGKRVTPGMAPAGLGQYSFRPSCFTGFSQFQSNKWKGKVFRNEYYKGYGSQNNFRGASLFGRGKGKKAMVCLPPQVSPPTPPPSFLRARSRLNWWMQHANPEVIQLIQWGVEHTWTCPQLPLIHQWKSVVDQKAALKILEEYQQLGAVKEVKFSEAKFLVPWFVIKKLDVDGGEKLRLISDCRGLNKFLETKYFKLDNWGQIFPFLRKVQWAVKIDLKDTYFLLELSEKIKPYVTLQVGEKFFQFQAACFGLSTLPRLWQGVMKTFLKLWRQRGLTVFIYLDDVIIFGKNPLTLKKQLAGALLDLENAGMEVNLKKSTLEPVQEVRHLGFVINLKEGVLAVPPKKLKSIRRELGKLLTHQKMSTRKMAAILGTVRSFLAAMPFLRAFTDSMLAFVDKNQQVGWDKKLVVPPHLQKEVREVGDLMQKWKGKNFWDRCQCEISTPTPPTGHGGGSTSRLDIACKNFGGTRWDCT